MQKISIWIKVLQINGKFEKYAVIYNIGWVQIRVFFALTFFLFKIRNEISYVKLYTL